MLRHILLIVLFISCASTFNSQKIRLTILHTNDHHGHYLADNKGQIGMAPRSTLIKQLRAEFKQAGVYSLLLSGGDINTGTMESDFFDAKPDFLGMNKLKYDAMAVGNHEFDNSFDVIKQQQEWAGFPFLAANIFYKGTNQRVFEPLYLVKNFKGIKVGIFGLTTKDTPFAASSEDAKNKFEFKNIIDSAKEVVSVLKKKEKVDYIILVTHVGHKGSMTANGDIHLAEQVAGIDIIVGGHSQEIINAVQVNNTIIVQAEDWGKYLGKLDLELTKQKLTKIDYQLIPVNLKQKVKDEYVYIEKEIKPDPEFIEMFASYKKQADELGNVVVGTLDKALSGDRKLVRRGQAPIAQFVGAALLNKLKNAEVAVINGGAIRFGLEPGEVSRKDLHTLHPYGNTLVSVKFSASEFFHYIEELSKINIVAKNNTIGGNPHYINMKLTYKKNKLQMIEAKNGKWKVYLDKNGKIHTTKKSFVLGTMNFLARGGDNYPKITTHKTYVDTGFMINSAMMEYFEKFKKVKRAIFVQKSRGILNFL